MKRDRCTNLFGRSEKSPVKKHHITAQQSKVKQSKAGHHPQVPGVPLKKEKTGTELLSAILQESVLVLGG